MSRNNPPVFVPTQSAGAGAVPGVASRMAATRILVRWIEHGHFPDRIAPDTPDRAFVMDMVYGVTRWRRTLNWVLRNRLRRAPDAVGRALLWLGAYQLLFAGDVADHAAVHATVETARGFSDARTGFINAVLRRLQREREACLEDLARQPRGIRLSHPDPMIQRWERAVGATMTEALCQWNNRPAHTILTTLSGQPAAGPLLRDLRAAGLDGATLHPAHPARCVILPRGVPVGDVPGYAEGRFIVQDPAALETVRLLDARPGCRVLDACAAPGGKTAQIAARLAGHGSLTAVDLHADRLEILAANLDRLHFDTVRIVQADAATCDPAALGGPFDRILIDAPCSNTGVLRRRPDARWRFRPERLQALTRTQGRLLQNLSRCLAPEGRLVYATCSLEPEENQALMARWMTETDGAWVRLATSERHPARDGIDGMFAVAIRRSGVPSACGRIVP